MFRLTPAQLPLDATNRRGVVMVLLVVGIVMLLAMTMISVDVASMQLARTELRAATDAAAKAGAEALLRTQDQSQAVTAALNFAQLNTVGGKQFKLATSNVVVGTSAVQTDGSWAFTAGGTKPNAVRINALMNAASASGSVSLNFGKVFKSGTFMPAKTSTASAVEQEICLCIDRSASMSWDSSGVDWRYPSGGEYDRRAKNGSRWKSLTTALSIYLTKVAATPVPARVALVTWANDQTRVSLPSADNTGESVPTLSVPSYAESTLEASLSYDFTTINNKITQRSQWPIYGGTNMAAGIDKAVTVLTGTGVKPFAQKTVLLMTDGQWNDGRDPVAAATDAANKGITIHVVTFLPGANNSDAQAVASTTGGTYIYASTEAELIAAFERLARTLPVVLTD
jgi:Flp pilus assembly protein TadG